jgi:adenylosuccinate synthase
MTDYFSTPAGLVIRFNGGAQAGHTVVTPDGKRHVFHHFGAGTLRGAATYLSKYFICNPMLFVKEHKELWHPSHSVFIDPRCLLTTPYDMLINELVERNRGEARHGSCGCGINETVVRCEKGFETTAGFSDINRDVLRTIANEYAPSRLLELGITAIPFKYKEYFHNEEIIKKYLKDYDLMKRHVEAMGFIDFAKFDSIVFEGAQGLGLDQNNKPGFPYLTRSNTGMKNVRQIADEIGIRDIETVYVTRCYVTRHGRGPLPLECDKPYKGIVDGTNVHNEFQEGLRFAKFDIQAFKSNIIADASEHSKISVAITCLDQTDDVTLKDMVLKIVHDVGVNHLYEGWGPTREDVKKF